MKIFDIDPKAIGNLRMVNSVKSISNAFMEMVKGKNEEELEVVMSGFNTEKMEVPVFFTLLWNQVLNEVKEAAVDTYIKHNHKASEIELSAVAKDLQFEFRNMMVMGFIDIMNARRKEANTLIKEDTTLNKIHEQIKKEGVHSLL